MPQADTQVPIAVLAGGRSPEHKVSVDSATQVVGALDPGRWLPFVALLDPDRADLWHVRSGAYVATAETARRAFDLSADDGPGWQAMSPGHAIEFLRRECGIQLAFPVFHGPGGEDGTVQGLLTLLGIPFVGSGVAASAIAIDKLRTRDALAASGIPMARAFVSTSLLRDADAAREHEAIAQSVGYPCYAKVDTSGSSLGVARLDGRESLARFFAAHRDMGRRWVVEAEVRGEEISVPVLGNAGERLEALPPVGVYPIADGHFSFEAKYSVGGSEEVVPPRGLDPEQIQAVQALAIRCHEVLQCDGMSRTDMIVAPDGDIRVLELNTIPGLTEASLLPKSAAHAGIPFRSLLDRLLDSGVRRWADSP